MKTINSQICAVDSRRCDYRRSPKIKVLNPALRTLKMLKSERSLIYKARCCDCLKVTSQLVSFQSQNLSLV